MKQIKRLRDPSSVVFGIVLTIAIGLFTFCAGLPYRLCVDWWARRFIQNPFEFMPKLWGWVLHEFGYSGLRGATVEIEGTVMQASDDELVVCIANHPPDLAAGSLVWFVTKYVAPRATTLGKRELLYLPFFGWALWAIRGAIFINRKKKKTALQSIRNGIKMMVGRANALILFPDMRRPTKVRIERDRTRPAFLRDIPDLQSWLKHTMVPRSGGLLELLIAIDRPVRVINITIAPTIRASTIGNVGQQEVLHIKIEEADLPKPLEEQSLRDWLNNEWRTKNQLIDRWCGTDGGGRMGNRRTFIP